MISYKKDMLIAGIYIIIMQSVIYAVNFISAHTINHSYAGDFFSTCALLNFLTNVFSFGSSNVLAKNIPLFKIKFSNSLWSNLKNMLIFFFRIFFIVLIIAILFDIAFYAIHISKYPIWENRYYNPSELFLFSIFIIITNSYFFSLFRAYGKMEVSYYYSIIGILFQFILFVASYHWKLYIPITINPQENIVLNYIIFYISGYLLSSILMFWHFKKYLFPEIKNKKNNDISNNWKKEIKYFLINAVQNDWIIASIIILEIFSIDENTPAIFNYMIGIIGIIYMINQIAKQTYKNHIAIAIISHNYKMAKQIILRNLIMIAITIFIISTILIYFNSLMLNSFLILQYQKIFIVLFIVEIYNTLFESTFTSFITLYSKKSLKTFVFYSSILYLTLIISGSIATVYYSLKGMIWVFILCTFIITTIEIILFIKYFLKFKHHCIKNNLNK